MYICICYGVSDKQIKQVMADGHADLSSVQAHTGAGLGCGSCVRSLEEIIKEHKNDNILPVISQNSILLAREMTEGVDDQTPSYPKRAPG